MSRIPADIGFSLMMAGLQATDRALERREPAKVTEAIEADPICSYCDESLSAKPATEYGLHVDCVRLLNADLDEAHGNVTEYIEG